MFADVVELDYQGRKLRAPIWIVPGHADDCLTVHLGYGRTRAGRVGSGAGFNAYSLRTSDSPWFGRGLVLRKTGERFALANTQLHYNMEGRELVRSASLADYLKNPNFAHEKNHAPPKSLSLYPPVEYNGYAWGMAIDLSTCIGCNACVVACQAENNIPDRRQGARSAAAARCIGCGSIATTRVRSTILRQVLSAGAVHALRERAVRSWSARWGRRSTVPKG